MTLQYGMSFIFILQNYKNASDAFKVGKARRKYANFARLLRQIKELID